MSASAKPASPLQSTPRVRGNFRSFLATATGFGTVGLRAGKPFLEVRSGTIDLKEIKYSAT